MLVNSKECNSMWFATGKLPIFVRGHETRYAAAADGLAARPRSRHPLFRIPADRSFGFQQGPGRNRAWKIRTVCQKYIDRVLKSKQGLVAYGGYLEKRGLYTAHLKFARKGEPGRNIHLGVDFWAAAGTPVVAPMAGRIHSFRDNKGMGDYGPTLILSHESPDGSFYSLYGHLSRDSLMGMERRQEIEEGDVLGFLGPPSVNGGYAPHLHFQLIFDLGTSEGDYPGVCSPEDLSFYTKNCPDPWSLLNKV